MLKDKIEAAKDVAKTAERFPWGTSVVVALLTTAVVWIIMRDTVRYANRRADRAEYEKDKLVNAILIKNQIIDNYRDTVFVQQELLKEADSAIKDVTVNDAVNLLKRIR